MVAIDPNSTLQQYYIHVRPSMMKFVSNDWNLEVCDYSRPSKILINDEFCKLVVVYLVTLALNNQIIRLLSDLGNHDGKFYSFQNRAFTQYEVSSEQQSDVTDIVEQKNACYLFWYVINLCRKINSIISFRKDNLLSNRIPISPTDGRNMFGVADETGELKYGECFIQYSSFSSTDNSQQAFTVVTGKFGKNNLWILLLIF